MDFSSFDWGTILLVCGLLCCGGFILSVVLTFVGGAFEVVFGLLGAIGDVLSGGPSAWCGCLVVVFGCLLCSGASIAVISLLQTCNTPDRVNLCRFFGM
ncbi:MAG: hypothetical protein ACOCZH_04955 [Phototrophicaceae bacterium]